MNTVWILHYLDGRGREYIILLNQEEEPTAAQIDENAVSGYEAQDPIRADLDDTGILPFEERLEKSR